MTPVGGHIQIDRQAGHVWKDCRDRDARVEAATTSAAEGISQGWDQVTVPQVVSVDAAQNRLCLQYLPGLIPLTNLIYGADERIAHVLLGQAATAMARLHAGMEVEPSARRTIPFLAGMADNEGPLHGDLTPANIFYNPAVQGLVFLDWCSGAQLGDDANWGDQSWDMAWMSSALFRLAPGPVPFLKVAHMADTMLMTYAADHGDLAGRQIIDSLERVLNFRRSKLADVQNRLLRAHMGSRLVLLRRYVELSKKKATFAAIAKPSEAIL